MDENQTTWTPAGSAEPHEETIELLPPEEAASLPQEEKDFRKYAGVPENAKSNKAWDNQRFRQVYRHYKDSERENTQLRTDMKAALEHSKRTAEAMENLAKIQTGNVTNEMQKKADAIQGELQGLEQNLSSLKLQKKAVRRNEEMSRADIADKEDEIDDKIDALKTQIARKTSEAEAAIKEAKEAERKTKDGLGKPAEKPSDTAAREFVQNTPWYNETSDDFDPEMAIAAERYDRALLLKPEWQDPTLENNRARLAKTREYIEKKFGWTKEGGATTPVARRGNLNLVEGVGNEQGGKRQGGAVQLTAEQKRIAHMMLDDTEGPANAEKAYAKSLGMI